MLRYGRRSFRTTALMSPWVTIAIAALSTAFLGGCGLLLCYGGPRGPSARQKLEGWHGRNVDEVLVTWGAPAGRSKLGTGAEVLTYKLTDTLSQPHDNVVEGGRTVRTYSASSLACDVNFITSVTGQTIERATLAIDQGCDLLVRDNLAAPSEKNNTPM